MYSFSYPYNKQYDWHKLEQVNNEHPPASPKHLSSLGEGKEDKRHVIAKHLTLLCCSLTFICREIPALMLLSHKAPKVYWLFGEKEALRDFLKIPGDLNLFTEKPFISSLLDLTFPAATAHTHCWQRDGLLPCCSSNLHAPLTVVFSLLLSSTPQNHYSIVF